MIYLTDYISEADIERELIGNKLSTFLDNNVDKNSIAVLLIWHFLANEESLKDFPNLKVKIILR